MHNKLRSWTVNNQYSVLSLFAAIFVVPCWKIDSKTCKIAFNHGFKLFCFLLLLLVSVLLIPEKIISCKPRNWTVDNLYLFHHCLLQLSFHFVIWQQSYCMDVVANPVHWQKQQSEQLSTKVLLYMHNTVLFAPLLQIWWSCRLVID